MGFRKIISLVIIATFVTSTVMPLNNAHAAPVAGLPMPGAMVNLSAQYTPLLIKGLKVHPENPLLFDFIVDTGNSSINKDSEALRVESEKLIKYFLATLTIPEKDLWVNLSPYEKDRIIEEPLGQTELGRDMLAQDYMLKQLTASMIYPEKELGKKFWDKIYTQARERFGNANVPVNTFNKVWILPDQADIFVRNNTAFVVGTHLKVMLEEDYLATQKNSTLSPSSALIGGPGKAVSGFPIKTLGNDNMNVASQMIREIILPEIEKEINEGQNFAPLRQIFNSIVLASWYKQNLKQALLNQVYTDKSKINGVDADDKAIKEKIYEQYLQAYKKGVFNYIKDTDARGVSEPRKYFSGGFVMAVTPNEVSAKNVTPAMAATIGSGFNVSVGLDRAMSSSLSNRFPDNYKNLQTYLLNQTNESIFKNELAARINESLKMIEANIARRTKSQAIFFPLKANGITDSLLDLMLRAVAESGASKLYLSLQQSEQENPWLESTVVDRLNMLQKVANKINQYIPNLVEVEKLDVSKKDSIGEERFSAFGPGQYSYLVGSDNLPNTLERLSQARIGKNTPATTVYVNRILKGFLNRSELRERNLDVFNVWEMLVKHGFISNSGFVAEDKKELSAVFKQELNDRLKLSKKDKLYAEQEFKEIETLLAKAREKNWQLNEATQKEWQAKGINIKVLSKPNLPVSLEDIRRDIGAGNGHSIERRHLLQSVNDYIDDPLNIKFKGIFIGVPQMILEFAKLISWDDKAKGWTETRDAKGIKDNHLRILVLRDWVSSFKMPYSELDEKIAQMFFYKTDVETLDMVERAIVYATKSFTPKKLRDNRQGEATASTVTNQDYQELVALRNNNNAGFHLNVDPMPVIPASASAVENISALSIQEKERLKQVEARMYQQNKIGEIVMVGGEATRFGGPKTFVSVDEKQGEFLQIKAANLRWAHNTLGTSIPMYLLASEKRLPEFKKSLAERQYYGMSPETFQFYTQGVVDTFIPTDAEIRANFKGADVEKNLSYAAAMRKANPDGIYRFNGERRLVPAGHYDALASFIISGRLTDALKQGIEFAPVFNIDNLQAVLKNDGLIAHFAEEGYDFGFLLAEKNLTFTVKDSQGKLIKDKIIVRFKDNVISFDGINEFQNEAVIDGFRFVINAALKKIDVFDAQNNPVTTQQSIKPETGGTLVQPIDVNGNPIGSPTMKEGFELKSDFPHAEAPFFNTNSIIVRLRSLLKFLNISEEQLANMSFEERSILVREQLVKPIKPNFEFKNHEVDGEYPELGVVKDGKTKIPVVQLTRIMLQVAHIQGAKVGYYFGPRASIFAPVKEPEDKKTAAANNAESLKLITDYRGDPMMKNQAMAAVPQMEAKASDTLQMGQVISLNAAKPLTIEERKYQILDRVTLIEAAFLNHAPELRSQSNDLRESISWFRNDANVALSVRPDLQEKALTKLENDALNVEVKAINVLKNAIEIQREKFKSMFVEYDELKKQGTTYDGLLSKLMVFYIELKKLNEILNNNKISITDQDLDVTVAAFKSINTRTATAVFSDKEGNFITALSIVRPLTEEVSSTVAAVVSALRQNKSAIKRMGISNYLQSPSDHVQLMKTMDSAMSLVDETQLRFKQIMKAINDFESVKGFDPKERKMKILTLEDGQALAPELIELLNQFAAESEGYLVWKKENNEVFLMLNPARAIEPEGRAATPRNQLLDRSYNAWEKLNRKIDGRDNVSQRQQQQLAQALATGLDNQSDLVNYRTRNHFEHYDLNDFTDALADLFKLKISLMNLLENKEILGLFITQSKTFRMFVAPVQAMKPKIKSLYDFLATTYSIELHRERMSIENGNYEVFYLAFDHQGFSTEDMLELEIKKIQTIEKEIKLLYGNKILSNRKQAQDRASLANAPGGIDFNTQGMKTNLSGDAINIQFDRAMIEQFKRGDFTGVRPVILNVSPITSMLPLLGLAPRREHDVTLGA